jgi:hypothetical protein
VIGIPLFSILLYNLTHREIPKKKVKVKGAKSEATKEKLEMVSEHPKIKENLSDEILEDKLF